MASDPPEAPEDWYDDPTTPERASKSASARVRALATRVQTRTPSQWRFVPMAAIEICGDALGDHAGVVRYDSKAYKLGGAVRICDWTLVESQGGPDGRCVRGFHRSGGYVFDYPETDGSGSAFIRHVLATFLLPLRPSLAPVFAANALEVDVVPIPRLESAAELGAADEGGEGGGAGEEGDKGEGGEGGEGETGSAEGGWELVSAEPQQD